jgi:hypothetical protein
MFLAIWLFWDEDTNVGTGLAGALILIGCIAVGIGIGALIHWLTSPKEVKATDKAEDFPEVKKLKAQGWQMGGEPTK